MSIEIKIFKSRLLEENTFIITDSATGDKAVIDPGCYTEAIKEYIGDPSSLKYILLTHAHGDHIYALPEFRAAYPDAKLVSGKEEAVLLCDSNLNGSAEMGRAVSDTADIELSDNDSIVLGQSTIKSISTPGHTIGGMCFYCDKMLFAGDTLFYMSVGATHFPTGSWEILQKSIREKLYVLPDNTEVYPGHGPVTLIGFEKKNNPYV